MASRRALAKSDQQPTPTKKNQPANIPDHAKVAAVAEKVLKTVGLLQTGVQPSSDKKGFEFVLRMVNQYVQRIVSPGKPIEPVVIETFSPEDAKAVAKNLAKDAPDVVFAIADPNSGNPKVHLFPRSTRRLRSAIDAARNLTPEELLLLPKAAERMLRAWYKPATTERTAKPSGASFPARANEQSEPRTHERAMLDDDRIIEKNGTRYFPLSLAAQYGQVARTTLVDWIKAKTAFQGRLLSVYNSATAHKSFLAEESVQRVAERFTKWREGKPAGAAGAVTLGETKDKSGYIGITKAAQTIGVDYHTLWLWATQPGKSSPTEEPLDVIRCSASEQFYIRESDVTKLKKIVPKTGLRRGPRAQPALHS